ncbi:MAG: RNA-binding cell elongation regulator Jag/EloR [Candidatus Caldatribacteriaceae bacterium]
MRRSVEVSGKSLEEVLERASRYFDVPLERLGYEVVSESKGFLSVFVPRMVKVRVWVEDEGTSESWDENTAELTEKPDEGQNRAEAREVVRGFLQELVSKMGLEVTLSVEEEEGVVRCALDGRDAGVLIGRRGDTLEALEVLVRALLTRRGLGETPLEVDVSGYRKRREEALRKLAERMAKKVLQEKKKIRLAPMNARERRIIHTALKDYPEVTTYSIGEEPHRRVVIDLKAETRGGDRNGKGGGRPRRSSSRPRGEGGAPRSREG